MPHPAALPHGTRLHNGAYAIGPVLGQGGFGLTYKGGDLKNKRYVAIKEFFPPGAIRQDVTVFTGNIGDDYARAKTEFLSEAQTLARFDDPSIVGVVGTFEENNSAYMVMEFLEGQTLGARLFAKGVLDEWEALDIALRLCHALETVHDAGVLHRDIKPDNIILTRDGRAVLIDFGSARALQSGAMTQIVTPGYAPLEQYASNARRGPGSDLYALGATLYHALSGHKPVAATDRAADVALAPLQKVAPALTPVVARAIMKSLEMNIERRPASAREFAALLRGQSPATPHAPAPARADETAEGALMHQTIAGNTSIVNALAFSPDGERLVAAGVDRRVKVWNPATGQLNYQFDAHDQAITTLSFSPDGAWLATGARDERVCIWDAALSDSRAAPLATLDDCEGVVHRLAFCPTRRELLVGDAGALTLWDASSGAIKARRPLCAATLAWSPDGARVAFGGLFDGKLRWCGGADLADLGAIEAHRGDVIDIAWAPNDSLLATLGSDGWVRTWSAANGDLAWEQRAVAVAGGALAWSPDGQILASSARESVLLWTARGALWQRYSTGADRVQGLAFSPRPNAPYRYLLASASRDKVIDLCRVKSDAP